MDGKGEMADAYGVLEPSTEVSQVGYSEWVMETGRSVSLPEILPKHRWQRVRRLKLVEVKPSSREVGNIGRLRWAVVPTTEEIGAMLAAIIAYGGSHRGAAIIMGMAGLTVDRWARRTPTILSARRVIWIHWCILFAPGRLRTVFDLITWGRFRYRRPRRGDPVPAKPEAKGITPDPKSWPVPAKPEAKGITPDPKSWPGVPSGD